MKIGLLKIFIVSWLVFSLCVTYAQDPSPNCFTAPVSCDGYSGVNPVGGPAMNNGWCANVGVVDNPGYIAFLASGNIMEFDVNWGSCTIAGGGATGIQYGIYSSNCADVPDNPIDCGNNCAATGSYNISIPTIPGEFYILMIDGCAGSRCDFTIDVVQGVGRQQVEEFGPSELINGLSNYEICRGAIDPSCLTFNISLVDLATEYLWTYNDNEIDVSSDPSLELNFSPVDGDILCVQGISQCDSNEAVCITFDVQPLPSQRLDTCICWNDFPVDIAGFTFNGPAVNQVIPLIGECNCEYDFIVTVYSDPEPFANRVVDAVCPDDVAGGGYIYPGQSSSDPAFIGPEVRVITLTDTEVFPCYNGPTQLCDDRIELDLRVMDVQGGNLSVPISCLTNMAVLDTSHLEFLPLGDPDLIIDLVWLDTSMSIISSNVGSISVSTPGTYTLEIELLHHLDDIFTSCTFSIEYIVTRPVCDCITMPGSMDLSQVDLCVGDMASVSLETPPVLETGHIQEYILHSLSGGTLGVVLARNDTGMFPYLPIYTPGTTYYISIAAGPALTNGEVDALDRCFALSPGQPIVWHAEPISAAGSDADACNLTYTLSATASVGSGMWRQLTGPGNSMFDMPISAGATVTVDMIGVYTYEWSEVNNVCNDMDTVQVTFRDRPTFIDAVVNCNASNGTYTVTLNIENGDEASYTVIDPSNTHTGSLSGSTFISNPIAIGTGYMFQVTDVYNCGTPDIRTDIPSCTCETMAGVMELTSLEYCQEGIANPTVITPPVLEAGHDTQFILHTNSDATLGTELARNSDGMFAYMPSYTFGQVYYISIAAGPLVSGNVDVTNNCFALAPGQPVVWYESPMADAGPNADACSPNFTLTGIPSVGDGNWIQIVGPGTSTLDDPSNPNAVVTVSEPGSYQFRWTETNSSYTDCNDFDDIQVIFRDQPIFTGTPIINCNSDDTYTVTLTIENGDAATYMVVDPRGLYTGTLTGSMFISESIPITDDFSFTISDQYGCGTPFNITEPHNCMCTSVPEFSSFSAPVTCVGDSATLAYTLVGNPPYTLDLTDGTTNYTITNYNSGDPIKILITGPTDITLVTITEELGDMCMSSPDETYPIDIEETPPLEVRSDLEVCNKALPGRVTSVNFNDHIIEGDMGGNWVDLDGSGGIGTLPNLDFTDVTPGDYRFEYTTNLPLLACTNPSEILLLTIQSDCPCPEIPIDPIPDLCNDETSLSLSSYLGAVTNSGDWTIISTPAGSNPMSISGETLNISGSDPGMYEIEFKLRNWPMVCPDSNRQVITLFGIPNAGTANGDVSFCEGEDMQINLFDYVDDEDTGGMWTASDASIAVDPGTGIFNTLDINAGDYVLTYESGPNGPCDEDQSMVSLRVVPNPIADAGPDQTFTCSDTIITLGGANTSTDNNITYQWFLDNVMIDNATDKTLEINRVGAYMLEVTNALSNCVTEDIVNVSNDDNVISDISAELRNESCDGEGTGTLRILNVQGGQEPYTYRLNGADPVEQSMFTDLEPGDYTLQVADAVNCSFTYEFNVAEGNAVEIAEIEDITVVAGDSIRVRLNVNRSEDQIALVDWASSFALNCDTCLTVTIAPLGTASYSVAVTDINGCQDDVQFRIIVTKDHDIYIPNVFHAQHGLTDESKIFRIYGSEKLDIVTSLIVVDRWGSIVHQNDNFDPRENFWDGTRSILDNNGSNSGPGIGALLPTGVYMYHVQVQFVDGTIEDFTGDVTLIR